MIRYTYVGLLVGVLSLLLTRNICEGCSCMESHPQEHFCTSDFVALMKVKGPGKSDYGKNKSYQIRVKKEFKMTDKARQALSHGFIRTYPNSSLCSISLKSTRYLIAGSLIGEKPWTSLCHFVKEWTTLTRKQKKGFRKLYQHGCGCTMVRSPMHMRMILQRPMTENVRYCLWQRDWEHDIDCQALHSVCIPDHHESNTCKWLPNRVYKGCVKQHQKWLERRREREP
ncbi:metalloproteinase inhibitor 2-like isoform X2 [Tachypleus tridentatus]